VVSPLDYGSTNYGSTKTEGGGLIKPITGLFLVFWGLVKVFQGWLLFDAGDFAGVAVVLLGALAALAGALFLADSLW
jgi:hypothetical protein